MNKVHCALIPSNITVTGNMLSVLSEFMLQNSSNFTSTH